MEAYFASEHDREPDDPTLAEIAERCAEFRQQRDEQIASGTYKPEGFNRSRPLPIGAVHEFFSLELVAPGGRRMRRG